MEAPATPAQAAAEAGAETQARGPRRPGVLALGVWLTARGAMVRASLGLAALGALGALAAAASMRGTTGLESLPAIASQAFAWGAGTTLAVGGALRALRNDREEGVVALARARGIGPAAYAAGRVGGLVVVLAIAVAGGTLVAGLAATAVATVQAFAVARASAAAIVFALAFALTLGPVAMATLGGRSRPGGYLWLLTVLVLPEALAPWTRDLLPRGWRELTSIPSALEAIRSGVETAGPALAHAARGAAGLVAVVAASLIVVRSRVPGDATTEDA
jgi:hypothetical protein